MEYIVKILDIEEVSHNVKKFRVEKPKDYSFISGQHTIVVINKADWKDKKRLFSFSSANSDSFLEFIVKVYSDREGVTSEFDKLKVSDELIIGEARGKMNYIGKGVFIAAGTGINPFISIFKELKKKNQLEGNMLIFSNRTSKEIILEKELKEMLGENIVLTLTRESKDLYETKRINKDFLKEKIPLEKFKEKFYLCGPVKFVIELKKNLIEFGVEEENIVSEF